MKKTSKIRSGVIKSTGDHVFDVVNILIMAVMFIIFVYPFWDTVMLSFSNAADASKRSLRLLPSLPPVFDAYKKVFAQKQFVTAFLNSVKRVAVGTSLSVAVTLCGGYVLAKKSLPFRNVILVIVLIPMFFSGGLVPTYLLMKDLKLTGSFWALILPTLTSTWNMLIARNFLMTVPSSLEEAAVIDGADPMRILTKIYLPLSKPIIAVLALWSAIGHWNAWFDAMIYTPAKDQMVLAYLLRKILIDTDTKILSGLATSSSATTPTTVKAATIVVAVIPITLLYPLLQKHFIKGINIGAVKG